MATPLSQSQEFTASGTFNVPALVDSIWLTAIGGGGGGGGLSSAQVGAGSGGGGSGEYVISMPVFVTRGGTVTVTIGAGGTGGTGTTSNGKGTDGGNTSFGVITVKGGVGGKANPLVSNCAGDGGGDNGGHSAGWTDPAPLGHPSPWHFTGGGSGGWASQGSAAGKLAVAGAAAINGYAGGAGGVDTSGPSHGGAGGAGGGGAASPFGTGGAGAEWIDQTRHDGLPAPGTSYGAGGGGGSAVNSALISKSLGGDGAGGYCLVQWIARP